MFDTAHIHVMIVHLPIMGTFLALIPLFWGIYKKENSVKWVGLIILAISLLGIPIATTTGESTEHAFRRGTLTAQLDTAGAQALEIHADAADYAATLGYIILALIAVLLFVWNRNYTWKNKLLWTIIVLDIFLVAGLGYVGYLGGQIRHTEFRTVDTTTTLPATPVAQ